MVGNNNYIVIYILHNISNHYITNVITSSKTSLFLNDWVVSHCVCVYTCWDYVYVYMLCVCMCVCKRKIMCICIHMHKMTSLVAQTVKHLSTTRETRGRSLGREDPLEKEMAIHSSTIAWKIPWTEEPDRLLWSSRKHQINPNRTFL